MEFKASALWDCPHFRRQSQDPGTTHNPHFCLTGYRFRSFPCPYPHLFSIIWCFKNSGKHYTCYYSFIIKDANSGTAKGKLCIQQRMGVGRWYRVAMASMNIPWPPQPHCFRVLTEASWHRHQIIGHWWLKSTSSPLPLPLEVGG